MSCQFQPNVNRIDARKIKSCKVINKLLSKYQFIFSWFFMRSVVRNGLNITRSLTIKMKGLNFVFNPFIHHVHHYTHDLHDVI